jgi:hypothetical protein
MRERFNAQAIGLTVVNRGLTIKRGCAAVTYSRRAMYRRDIQEAESYLLLKQKEPRLVAGLAERRLRFLHNN